MRTYGTGNLWLRKSKRHPTGEYWIRFRDAAGRLRTQNSHFCECHDKRAEASAERMLAKQLGLVATGNLPSPRAAKALVEDLAQVLLKARRVALLQKIPEGLPAPTRAWREQAAAKLIADAERRWSVNLQKTFGNRKASLVTTEDLNDYVIARHKAKAMNATINREMAFLRRAFKVGFEARPRLVAEVPTFPPKLPETARTGFIEDAAFNKLLAALKEPGLRAMVLTAYRLGFRMSELKNLLVLQVAGDWIVLFAGTTKNSKARKVPMPEDVCEAVQACCAGKDSEDHVFTWPNGKPILDFRTSWAKACKEAGVPDLRFHDLRRSATRNIMRKGIPATVAMKITGHLTRAVFDAYDVTADQDLLDAAGKI
jgi:integrase